MVDLHLFLGRPLEHTFTPPQLENDDEEEDEDEGETEKETKAKVTTGGNAGSGGYKLVDMDPTTMAHYGTLPQPLLDAEQESVRAIISRSEENTR